ncbi:MAG TPA: AMP-binding protein [Acetobacteraceae bacterium]|nr:AMP-binding protein [Acetobacteraceae bacterium]
MYLGDHARARPDHPALIDAGSGAVLTYGELDARSNQLAHLLRARGLKRGDTVALYMENNPRYLEIVWAALRSGLYLTAVNRYLTAEEAAYIINDSDAAAVISSHAKSEVAAEFRARCPACRLYLMTDGATRGWDAYESAIAASPPTPLTDESAGELMLYSSGTTGRPKGVRRALRDAHPGDDTVFTTIISGYDFGADTVYLSPAPMYHAAPLAFSTVVQRAGGTVVMMPRFDAAECLALIERYRVTHAQFVPTMFVRMLKLPEEERRRHDLSSLRIAIHAAAPCPAEVKRAMIDWWGPIIHEYYGGTEGNGRTALTAEEWLAHPGSVGRAVLGTLHICDEAGAELPAGESGLVYFEREAMPFAYHKDEARTRAAQHPRHPNWSTLGDVGYVDAEGYLYLTDRKAFMIISGGVNIYPREIEDVLITHPLVQDVAVFGLPDPEMGERVHAVIEPAPGAVPGPELAGSLLDHAARHLARFKLPKTLDFTEALPRLPTGKLYKKALRDEYLARLGG